MTTCLYRWHNIGPRVQGFVAEEVGDHNTYELVTCPACKQVHLVIQRRAKSWVKQTNRGLDCITLWAHPLATPANPNPQGAMDRFVERKNIAHYVNQLKIQTDPAKRKMLQTLLVEEQAKLASHGTVNLD